MVPAGNSTVASARQVEFYDRDPRSHAPSSLFGSTGDDLIFSDTMSNSDRGSSYDPYDMPVEPIRPEMVRPDPVWRDSYYQDPYQSFYQDQPWHNGVRIEVSTDDTAYTEVFNLTSSTGTALDIPFAETPGRYIRITNYGGSTSALTLSRGNSLPRARCFSRARSGPPFLISATFWRRSSISA